MIAKVIDEDRPPSRTAHNQKSRSRMIILRLLVRLSQDKVLVPWVASLVEIQKAGSCGERVGYDCQRGECSSGKEGF